MYGSVSIAYGSRIARPPYVTCKGSREFLPLPNLTKQGKPKSFWQYIIPFFTRNEYGELVWQ